jgi:hypothetical protein
LIENSITGMAVFSGGHRFKPPVTSGMTTYVALDLLLGNKDVAKTAH